MVLYRSIAYPDQARCIGQILSPVQKEHLAYRLPVKPHSSVMFLNSIFLSCKMKHMLTAVQVRLSYLQILGDLKMYNGKIFNATLMVRVLFVYVIGFWHTVLLPGFVNLVWQCTWTVTAKIGYKKQF